MDALRLTVSAASALTAFSLAACARTTPSSEASAPPPASAVAVAPAASTPTAVEPAPPPGASTDPPPGPPFASACEGVVLDLALKRASTGLEVEPVLRNKGKAPVELMLTGDGSSFDRRNPTLRFELAPNDIASVGTCGFINAVTDAEFVTIKPGESRKLEWAFPPTPGKPGRYTLKTVYRNDPNYKKLLGAPSPLTPAQAARQAKTTPCEVTSNALTFAWDGKSAKPAP